MSVGWERDRAAVRAVVDRVAASYGAVTVLADGELGPGGAGGWRVVSPSSWARDAGTADVVLSFDAPARGAGWDAYLGMLGERARSALLVFARNAERIGRHAEPGVVALARVLWQIGRVREHAYLGLPRLAGASAIVQVPAGVLVRRTARWHVFVVETAPRTPQARRRLGVVPST